jgi:hypothetical protein
VAEIFIATPVYRGARTLRESLRSIVEQTFTDYRCLISVDPGDDDSASVCREMVGDDPRFEIVEQDQRLGWPGNFNWLIGRCDAQWFVYWQQDDLCSTRYLEVLRAALAADPAASVAYTDVQWFGDRIDRHFVPSFDGPPVARVLQVLEDVSYVPLRGLIRADALPPEGIVLTPDLGAQSEFVFLARLAAAGAFVRVDGALCFKRGDADSAGRLLHRADEDAKRREWANMGARILGVALEHAPAGGDGTLLALVLDRLAIARPGRGYWVEPAQDIDLVRETALRVAATAGLDLGDDRWLPGNATGLERPVHPLVHEALVAERGRAGVLAGLAGGIRRGDAGDLAPHLGWGWHAPEPWGAWTRGTTASLELGGAWPGGELVLHGHFLPRAEPVRFGWSCRGTGVQWLDVTGGRVDLNIPVPLDAPRLVLHLPDSTSPAALHVAPDGRTLGVGLECVELLPSADGMDYKGT